MKKTILLCITFLFIFSSIDAQKIKWGPHYKKEGGLYSNFFVVGHDAKHYYVNMRPKKKGGTLLTFDYNHKLVSNKKIQLKYNGKKITPSSFIKTNSKTFAYMWQYDKKQKKYHNLVAEFNKGKFGKVKKIFEENREGGGYRTSANKKYVVFYSHIENKSKADEIKITVFDENLKKVWKKTQKFPYRDKDLVIDDFLVSDEGKIFISTFYRDRRKKKDKEDDIQSTFKIFKVTEGDFSEIAVTLKNKDKINEANLFLQPATNDVYLGGFYSEYGKKKRVSGVFFGKIDIHSEAVELATHKFSEEFMEGLATKKQIKKDKGVSYSFDILKWITFDDGSFSFIAEKLYTKTHQTYSNGQWRTYYTYHSDEIIIPRFNTQGDLIHIEKIEKNFGSRAIIERSFAYIPYDGKIYLVFNDYKKRAERKEVKNSGIKKGSRYTDICIINQDGKVEKRKTIFTNKEVDSFFVPSLSFSEGNKLVIGTRKMKKYKFGTLKL